jgi:MFS family permease
VLFVQLLNGVNYPLLTVAAVNYADDHAPKGYRATAQGLFRAAMGGIGAAIGAFSGGILIENIGAKGMYLVFCLFVILVLAVISFIYRAIPPEQERVLLKDSIDTQGVRK